MKRILILVSLLLATEVWSDATITGRLVDNNNQPLAGVSVFVVGAYGGGVYLDLGTVTDADGSFNIFITYELKEQRIASANGVISTLVIFNGRNVKLEFGSADVLPHRWAADGIRALDCAFGCRSSEMDINESFYLDPSGIDFDLGNLVLPTGAGKQYIGSVLDVSGQVVPDQYVTLEGVPGGDFTTNYFPAMQQLNGTFESLAVPNQADMFIAALAPDHTKIYHDGTQCERIGFCRPAEPAMSSQEYALRLKKSATIWVNPPTLPQGDEQLNRQARLYDELGRYLGIGDCDSWAFITSNSTGLQACRFDRLIPTKKYRMVFIGYDNLSGVLTPMQRVYHNGQASGCGMHWKLENFPESRLSIGANNELTIDFPDLQAAQLLSGSFVDSDSMEFIFNTEPSANEVYLDLIDSKTLKPVGNLNIQGLDFEGDQIKFSSCVNAGIDSGSYYLALANQTTYSSFVEAGSLLRDYKRFVYGGIDCVGQACDFTGASVIEIDDTEVTDINIVLEKGSRIHGCYHNADQSPLLYVSDGLALRDKISVQVFSEQGELLETSALEYEDLGNDNYQLCYSSSAYPAGNYRLRTNNGTSRLDGVRHRSLSGRDIFDHRVGYFDTESGIGANNCSGSSCDLTELITLDGSNHVERDFYLYEGPVISAVVKDLANGSLLTSRDIFAELYDSQGNWMGRFQFISRAGRFSTPALANGDYEIRISGAGEYFALDSAKPPYQASGLHQNIVVTIEDNAVDIGVISLLINDLIFNDGFEN